MELQPPCFAKHPKTQDIQLRKAKRAKLRSEEMHDPFSEKGFLSPLLSYSQAGVLTELTSISAEGTTFFFQQTNKTHTILHFSLKEK